MKQGRWRIGNRGWGGAFWRLCLLALVMLVALLPESVAAQEQQDAPLRIAAGERVEGDLATFTRDIVVLGEVTGDVTSWGGHIAVEGHVYGDVVSYAGGVTLGAGAQVDGQVLALGDRVQQLGGAQVSGQILGAGRARVTPAAVPGLGSLSGVLVVGALAVGALAACSVVALVWPRRTQGVARTLASVPGRALGVGLLSLLLLAGGLVLAAIALALTLVGSVLIVPLALLLHLPLLAGLAGLAYLLGARLLPPTHAAHPERAVAVGALLLLTPITLLTLFAPLPGLVLFYLVSVAGLGALVLSRAGVRGKT